LGLLDIYFAQLIDPFRIGLIVALVVTAANTSGSLNRLIPLALGVVFVAVLIPNAFSATSDSMMTAVGVGLFSNLTILAVVLGVEALYRRLVR